MKLKTIVEQIMKEAVLPEKYKMFFDGDTLSSDAAISILGRLKMYHKDVYNTLPAKNFTDYTKTNEYGNVLIKHFNETLSDAEQNAIINSVQGQLDARDPKKEKQRMLQMILSDYPQLSKEDILDGSGNIRKMDYEFKNFAKKRWRERVDINEWQSLKIVHWFSGNGDLQFEKAYNFLSGKFGNNVELSATYYPTGTGMKTVGKNRWGNIAIELKGTVTSGFAADAASDDYYSGGKSVNNRHVSTDGTPTEKFGGKNYTLRPRFQTDGWNELLIKDWKIVKFFIFSAPQQGEYSDNEKAKFKQLTELLTSKKIPFEVV